jgi:hypothetical protein
MHGWMGCKTYVMHARDSEDVCGDDCISQCVVGACDDIITVHSGV